MTTISTAQQLKHQFVTGHPLVTNALIFVGIYAFFPFRFPLISWFHIAQTSFARMTNHDLIAAAGLTLAGLALVMLNKRLWQVVQCFPRNHSKHIIVLGWIIASICLLFAYPGQSSDIADYSFRAHMLAHLGKNPVTTSPSAVIEHAAYPYLAWYKEICPYGPLWHLIAATAHAITSENLLGNFMAFKIIAILATGISGWLIYSLLRQMDPRYAEAGLALWLLNPVVLNEGALNGHNDLVMLVPVLLGLKLLLTQHEISGLIALILAGLVKAHAWVLLPVVALWLVRQNGWREGIRKILLGGFAGMCIVWIAYFPLGGWGHLLEVARNRSWWPTCTWTATMFYALRDGQHLPHEVVLPWTVGSTTLLFFMISGVLMQKVRDLRTSACAISLTYLLVGTHWFQSWYAVLPVALVAITPHWKLTEYIFLFSFFMLLHPIVAQYVVAQIELAPGGYDFIMAATTLLIPQVAAIRLLRKSAVNIPASTSV